MKTNSPDGSLSEGLCALLPSIGDPKAGLLPLNSDKRLFCPQCSATVPNTSRTRGRFLRRHNCWFCATQDYLAYLERKRVASEEKAPANTRILDNGAVL